jgi:hypothetical protein
MAPQAETGAPRVYPLWEFPRDLHSSAYFGDLPDLVEEMIVRRGLEFEFEP